MIDIHSHALYGVDDGAKDINETLEMIKSAMTVGVTSICFTPHYMEDGYKSTREDLEKRVAKINSVLGEEKINFTLYLGEEVYIYPDLAENLDKIISLNDSKYVLFELPLFDEANYVDDVVYKLISYGKIPVLAHPERYLISNNNYNFLKELVDKGVLLQINLNSLVGHYGSTAKRIATKLLKDGLVTFASSDAHSVNGYLNLKYSIQELIKIVGDKEAEVLISENPLLAVNNKDIEVKERVEYKAPKFAFNFWKKRKVV